MNNRRYRTNEGAARSGLSSLYLPNEIMPLNRCRKKRCLAWEEAELASNGLYAQHLREIELRYPALTPMELRVCALVKAMQPNWKIAEILGISEKTVENHRRRARIAIGCSPSVDLRLVLI